MQSGGNGSFGHTVVDHMDSRPNGCRLICNKPEIGDDH